MIRLPRKIRLRIIKIRNISGKTLKQRLIADRHENKIDIIASKKNIIIIDRRMILNSVKRSVHVEIKSTALFKLIR